MLSEFLEKNRDALIVRCREKVATRRAPRASEHELWYGVPLFLDQLLDTLRREPAVGTRAAAAIGMGAAQHGNDLLRRGFTVDEVVHNYGDLCQAISEAAAEENATISAEEFGTLNRCLDNAIAAAVTEYGRQHDEFLANDSTQAMNERLGFLAHELRNLIGTATIAVATMKKGRR